MKNLNKTKSNNLISLRRRLFKATKENGIGSRAYKDGWKNAMEYIRLILNNSNLI